VAEKIHVKKSTQEKTKSSCSIVVIGSFDGSEPVHKQKPSVGELTPLILEIHRYSQALKYAAA
jgi:hypothetical protein